MRWTTEDMGSSYRSILRISVKAFVMTLLTVCEQKWRTVIASWCNNYKQNQETTKPSSWRGYSELTFHCIVVVIDGVSGYLPWCTLVALQFSIERFIRTNESEDNEKSSEGTSIQWRFIVYLWKILGYDEIVNRILGFVLRKTSSNVRDTSTYKMIEFVTCDLHNNSIVIFCSVSFTFHRS